MNIVIFFGYLGADPDLRETPNGQTVCNFPVASHRHWKDADGEQIGETTWFRVAAWGRLAQVCSQHLLKGDPVFVSGRLIPDHQTGGPRIWLDANGEPRASYEVTATEVKFLAKNLVGANDTGVDAEEIPQETNQDEMQF